MTPLRFFTDQAEVRCGRSCHVRRCCHTYPPHLPRLEEQAAASTAVAKENDELRAKLMKALESIDVREQHAACQVGGGVEEVQMVLGSIGGGLGARASEGTMEM